jgi:hypothetical protein
VKAEGELASRHLAGCELQARIVPDLPLRLVKSRIAFTPLVPTRLCDSA